ncbi:hypothetical protein EDD21DRAFT_383702 [Dissophora ornata]|nr:hypothetical protein EDD21DRAFT_383702 [Dissophora ornata]
MSIKSVILGSALFQKLFSLSIWFLLLGTPLLFFAIFFYCMAKGTGNVAGLVVDKTAKKVRSYQQLKRKREKMDPPVV